MTKNAGCGAMGFTGATDIFAGVTDIFGNAAGGDDDALGNDDAICVIYSRVIYSL